MKNVLLLNGDCLIEMQKIPDDSVDLILCDLPYAITKNSWDALIPFDKLWEQYNRICKGRIVLTASQPFTTKLIMSNIEAYNHIWVWIKNKSTGFQSAKYQPLRQTEDVIVFNKGTYNPQGLVKIDKVCRNGKSVGGGNLIGDGEPIFKPGSTYVQEFTGYPKNVLEFPLDSIKKGSFNHPTQKPLSLFEYLIKTYSNEGDVVLDNCMGSGTSGHVAVNTDRIFIGIEFNPEYFGHAKKRIKDAYNEKNNG